MLIRKNLQGSKKSHMFLPDFIAKSVTDIDFDLLTTLGVKSCFIDLDGTVVSRGEFEVRADIVAVLKKADQSMFIATNRPKSRDLKTLQHDLKATGVIHPHGLWGKPFKRYYRTGLKEHGFDKHEVVMIGDRYLQDIYGANRAGMYTLLIGDKLGASKGIGDKLLSKAEHSVTHFIAKCKYTGKV